MMLLHVFCERFRLNLKEEVKGSCNLVHSQTLLLTNHSLNVSLRSTGDTVVAVVFFSFMKHFVIYFILHITSHDVCVFINKFNQSKLNIVVFV